MSFFQIDPQSQSARRAIRDMLALDDRQLDDIGYTRSALEWALSERDARAALSRARSASRPYLRTRR